MEHDWQMPRAGRACAGCARAFVSGQTFRALLYEARAGYERRDYCDNCTVPAEPVPVATWRTQRAAHTGAAGQPFDREAIYGVFTKLEDADTPEQTQFRFVLALVLWRKKVLKFRRTVEAEGREYWEFSAAQAEEPHRVERPEIDESQLEQLSAQLEQLLANGRTALDAAETGAEGHGDG